MSNTQYQPVVRRTKLFIKLKYVQITASLGGLPAISVQRKEISFAKLHTSLPLYCAMI